MKNKILFIAFSLMPFFITYESKYQVFRTLIPVLSSFILISSIKNKYIRASLITIFFILCFSSVVVRRIYGSFSKNMLLAAMGVDFKVSIGLLEEISVSYFILSVIVISIVFFLSFSMKKTTISFWKMAVICFVSMMCFVKPIKHEIKIFGTIAFINNNIYDKTFLAQEYMDQNKIFFGDLIALSLIELDSVYDRIRYKKVDHDKIPEGIEKTNKHTKNVILIIGEASNVKRYGAYGYKLNTTPNLNKFQVDNHWCALQKVHSPAAQTRVAVPMLVSFSSPEHKDFLFSYENILEIAKSEKYKTYWIDSQNGKDLWDKPFGFVEKYSDIHVSPTINNTKFNVDELRDDQLLSPIQYYFKNSSGMSFFVIHLFGSHMPYNENIDKNDQLEGLDVYDQSIHHTDMFISKVKSYADEYLKNYSLVYVPDHGEVVNYGHGYPSDTNEMYLIPVISNDNYACSYLEKFRGDDGYISSNDIKYLILQYIGYDIKKEYLNHERENSYKLLDFEEKITDFRALKY